MKTENLNEFLKLMQKVKPISDAHTAAMIHKGISNEIEIEFKTHEESFEISSSYIYGAAHIHIDNKECIVLDYDGFEASAFDWGDQITLNVNDDDVYIKVFEEKLVDCTLNAVTNIFNFCWDDFDFEYIINDEDDANAAYFQISTMFTDDLITEEEFVNQFIAYFKLKEIMSTINTEFNVQICLSNDSGLPFSNFLNNLKFPKVEFV